MYPVGTGLLYWFQDVKKKCVKVAILIVVLRDDLMRSLRVFQLNMIYLVNMTHIMLNIVLYILFSSFFIVDSGHGLETYEMHP